MKSLTFAAIAVLMPVANFAADSSDEVELAGSPPGLLAPLSVGQ